MKHRFVHKKIWKLNWCITHWKRARTWSFVKRFFCDDKIFELPFISDQLYLYTVQLRYISCRLLERAFTQQILIGFWGLNLWLDFISSNSILLENASTAHFVQQQKLISIKKQIAVVVNCCLAIDGFIVFQCWRQLISISTVWRGRSCNMYWLARQFSLIFNLNVLISILQSTSSHLWISANWWANEMEPSKRKLVLKIESEFSAHHHTYTLCYALLRLDHPINLFYWKCSNGG